MKFLDLKNISEQFMELVNPTSPEKLIKAGLVVGLKAGDKVIDFGCGFAEPLVLWAERFGISGVGIDIRPYACERAQKKIADRGLADRLQIVCGNAAEYKYPEHSFDLAACIGATFIWSNFAEAVRSMKQFVKPGGKLVIGEAHWLVDVVPEDFRAAQTEITTEVELLRMAHQEGYEFEYVLHSNHDEWDRYEADNWVGLLHWIESNPNHPERQEVIDHLHESQEEYIRHGRMYFGWALYVLSPQYV
jgi:ubiquinone/menaquinone biosynthesis C-methylase UbiE